MRLISTGLFLCGVIATGACGRRAAAPELQTSSGVQPLNNPTTVSGCLKAGLGESTFVLTALDPATTATVTYQLIARADQNLKDHVGERVDISGTVTSQQELRGTSGAEAVKPAKGTSGTPMVETKTELDVRQLRVDAITPLGDRCQ